MRVKTYKEIIENKEDVIFIDLRTENEHSEETIPNSHNIPVFTNEERAIVGTLYKKVGTTEATKKAVEFVSKRLPYIFEKIDKLSKMNKTLVFFCARGGMRSSSVVGLFEGLKYNAVKLDFGYKGYRAYVNKQLPIEFEKISLVTLYGKTGTGKTRVLHEIKKMGYDILDLEGAANHRGSILGSVGLSKQNSQKQFEGCLLDILLNRKSDLLFTEGESKRIGKIIMKEFIYDKILASRKILIKASTEFRINIIKDDYFNDRFKKEDLIFALEKLRRYISNDRIDYMLKEIELDQYDFVIKDLMLNYYDLNYRCNDKIFEHVFENNDNSILAKKIIDTFVYVK